MRRATWRGLAFIAGLMTALGAKPDAAADTLPPCWRGQPGSTVQTWRFDTGANPATPEIATNPNGAAAASVSVSPVGAGWLNQLFLFGTNQGVWDLGGGGSMALTIPNEVHPSGHWKLISVQVYQFRDGSIYNQVAPVSVPGATRISGEVRPVATNVIGPGLVVTWIVDQSLWLMESCPASEQVVISAPGATTSSAIDVVVVDTICLSADNGDIFPPCWRGNASASYQSWSFHNPSNPIAAEQTANTLSATAGITQGPFASGWQASDPAIGCRNGFWDLGSAGSIDLNIQRNAGPPGAYSYVQVQVTQFRDALLYNQLPNISLASAATLVSRTQQILEPTITGEWIVDRTIWRVPNCPASETVTILAGPNGALIDQAVVDSLCLDYTCPGNISLSADTGECSRANVSWPLPVVDGCKIAAVACSPASGSTFAVGTTPVSCSITDGLGGTLACNFTVTVTDNELPIAQCPANIMVVGNPGVCGTNVSFVATASDNCPGATVSCSPASGSVFPVGQTTVTCAAVDAAANSSAPCSFTVTVIDLSGDAAPPCWRAQTGSTFQHWAFHTPANPATPELGTSPGNPLATVTLGALATGWQDQPAGFGCKQGFWDLGGAGTISLDVPNVALAGAYKYVRVQVTQFQDSLIYNQLAAVALTPSATLVSRTQELIEATLTGAWVVDETVWQLATCPASENVLITAGPFSSLIDQVVVDTLCIAPPVCPTDITGIADSGLCVKTNIAWSLPPADGCVVRSVVCLANGVPTASPGNFPVGVTAVACAITDAEGQTNHCNFLVTITDTQPPIAQCRNITVALNGIGQAVITAAQVDNGSSDNCGVAGLAVNPTSFSCANIGPNAVTLAVTDVNGNSSTCAAIVTVIDNLPPTIACPADVIVNADPGLCSASGVALGTPTTTDNCGVAGVVNNAPSPFPVGTTLVTWTVTDVNGLTATCTQRVIVADTQPPAIACPADVIVNVDAGLCSASGVALGTPTTADNCSVATVANNAPTIFPVGTNIVTWTVTDVNGLTATCQQRVIVQPLADLSVQVVSAPEPVTVGQPVSYTVTVANLGPCPASGVTVNNVLSAGQVLVSVTDPGTSLARACPTPGPSAWYRAEGNASDSVGVNHGTINGGVTFGPQAVGQGFIFDGLTGYISVPDAPALRPASLTIEGWIKIGDPNGLHVVLSKPQGSGLADSYSVWIASGVLHAAVSDATGSGPFLTYPNFPTSSIFLFDDILNLPSLANKLKTPAPLDFVSQYLNSQLSVETLALLAAYAGGPDAPLQRHIVADFNRIIQNGPLYTVPRFLGVTLSDETLYVLGRNPTGIDLVRLNRLLIRDTYSTEIVTILFPQLTQRYHIAYTFDPGTGQQALYVNGDLVDSSFVTKTITYTGRPLVIGAGENAGSADYFYQGEIDELAIYDRALSGIEAQAIHSAGANGKCFNNGAVVLGSLAGGATQTFTVVAVPVTCPSASLQATVSGTETDPVLANNTATATATVVELPASLLSLSIRRISPNNDHVEISWPITCAPFILETTDDLSPALILWTPAIVPVQTLQGRYSTVVPASDPHHFFRLKSP